MTRYEHGLTVAALSDVRRGDDADSQDLEPIQRLSWSITAWRRRAYLDAVAAGQCAAYAGRVGFHPISALAGHIIKTERDLQIADALLPVVEEMG